MGHGLPPEGGQAGGDTAGLLLALSGFEPDLVSFTSPSLSSLLNKLDSLQDHRKCLESICPLDDTFEVIQVLGPLVTGVYKLLVPGN